MPLCACGQSAPAAKKRVAMATPKAPLAASRAMIDHVMRRDDTQKISRCYARPMKLARLAIGSCAVLALATIALDADAGKGRGGGGGGRGHAASGGSAGHHHHHHHHHSRVFIGTTLVAWPPAYTGMYYGPGY